MGKKRKPQTARQSIDVLAAQAESHLQAGRFREAMDAYKQLLKGEQHPPQWREGLPTPIWDGLSSLQLRACTRRRQPLPGPC
ncbi:hypothetical protein [Nitrosococcus wardiae]|uniref:Tetratricopeptide repeat protein n=1 Tax=Nitrosococcus wardiae TaxID=1814290 RepID=A0A4P7C4X1_9GAMM|nr:hypothetical protein [Nitrosococcus wardiae]QBQ56016.1 hypothetical protein E3U44_17000 [Nitrosococcus wardiae]